MAGLYARRHWSACDDHAESTPTRDQHLNYFLRLTKRAESELRRADQITWLNRLETKLGNFRAAFGWSLQRSYHTEVGLWLAAVLIGFWHIRDHKIEGVDWLERTLLAEACEYAVKPRSEERILARTQALNANGYLLISQGNLAKQIILSEESLALSRELSSNGKHSMALALWNLVSAAQNQQDYDQMQDHGNTSMRRWCSACERSPRARLCNVYTPSRFF